MDKDNFLKSENAVAAIRVSSTKQGTDGDSPEAQREQIERFAQNHNINIKKFFVFMESASKKEQPMQEAVNYCKSPKNDIQLFIIKSIDRFTRGGSYSYDDLKMQLERYGVKLVDIYGVISQHKVNTLEHLGISFDWSVYSPTKKAEILEAERAKDELRDIMSRMIGAEIRYARMGYWVREAPMGYITEKIETSNGKRCILKPHPVEAKWFIKMFELRCRGTMSDHTIVKQINKMGFKTRIDYVRDPKDRTKIIRRHGGNPFNIKGLWRYLQNPIYAGISADKWTEGQRVRGKWEGLVSIETFNKANKGKIFIVEEGNGVKIYKKQPPEYLLKKGVRNPDFPYKKVIMCPTCERPLLGSASRGRLGKYYPAYHCDKRGHNFRVSKEALESVVSKFIQNIELAPGYPEELTKCVVTEWDKRQAELSKDVINYDERITQLKTQAQMTVDKLKYLTSEVAIKYMEQELVKIEEEIGQLAIEKEKADQEKPTDARMVMAYIEYFLKHMDELLLKEDEEKDPVFRANCFGVLFDQAPTYQELNDLTNQKIESGTPKLAHCIKLNEVFKMGQEKLAAE